MNGLIRYTRPNALFDWNSVLDNFFTDTPVWRGRTPAVDVRENENEYLLEVELPGLTEGDIELKVEENLMTLSSKQEESREEKKNDYLIRERRSTEFSRSFVLPKDIDRDTIKAEFKNGLLTVAVAKLEKAKPKVIDVSAN